MSDHTSHSDPQNSDATTELADTIQSGQDIIESVKDDIPAEVFEHLETVEDDLERLEDGIEDGDDTLPDGFEADVQSTQDDVGTLQKNLNTSGADHDLILEVEDLEDTVETIEDRGVDARSRYGVKVDTDPVEFFDDSSPAAETILARFNKDTDDALVEKDTENTYSGDDEVDLSGPGVERFTTEPRTPGNS